jgi:hypothetical protein
VRADIDSGLRDKAVRFGSELKSADKVVQRWLCAHTGRRME